MPGGPVQRIAARVGRRGSVLLDVAFVLEGDLTRLRIPPPVQPRIAADLWQHTCFEIFIARPGMPAYHEFNFSPSGEWTAFAFSDYRQGAQLAEQALDPVISAHRAPDSLRLEAVLPLERLTLAGAPLSLGLSAVVEDERGELAYWALAHPGAKPDFHHRGAFVLNLDEATS
jgi:hypothetical protein